jgi:hypothetical protein
VPRDAIRWFAIEAFMSCFNWLCAVVSEAGRRFLVKPCEPSEQFPCGGLVGWSFSGMKQVLNFSLVASWLRLGFLLLKKIAWRQPLFERRWLQAFLVSTSDFSRNRNVNFKLEAGPLVAVGLGLAGRRIVISGSSIETSKARRIRFHVLARLQNF